MSGWLSRADGCRGRMCYQGGWFARVDGYRGDMFPRGVVVESEWLSGQVGFQGGASPAPTIFGIQIPRIVVACDDNNPPLP